MTVPLAAPVAVAGPIRVAPVGAAGREVVCVNPLTEHDWDQSLSRWPDATLFHGSAWARALVETYGFTCLYLVTRGAGAITGMLPLMEVRSWLTGRRGVGLPFTDEGEPLAGDPATFDRLQQAARDLGVIRGWRYLELRGGERFMAGGNPSIVHWRHQLELTPEESVAFAQLQGAVRQAVRKAVKAGLQVEFASDLETLRSFYYLQCRTRRRHGLPPQPWAWFAALHRNLIAPGLGVVALARAGRTPVSGAVYLHAGRQATFKYGASDERWQHCRGNNLVMWEAMKWLARQGVRQLHLGRTAPGHDGLRRFKLGFGARECALAYYRYDFGRRQPVVVAEGTTGWHNQVFRLAPPLFARLAGRYLYRHWA